ncbi:hypothetical protein JKA74_12800 [Marivirga sp. S37H4]|uniref:Collagen-like protein n=1 Tax=Marivirga aurantiaca TaxID=2802615 RepID=A0A935C9C4_9BACT|nr:hypothetical protein [Marivirga aurantiaca]MBK6265914.1 hypothetical protein [Marivirga aurantiaca]
MKNLFYYLQILAVGALIASCTVNGNEGPPGPRGPQGPAGQDGQDGLNGEEAFVFEFEEVTFVSPDYEVFLEFPEDFQMLDSDKVLVYFLWEYIEEDDLDIWRALPQVIFTEFGTLQYNYDFSKYDVRLFMEGNFNLNVLGAGATDNWIVRAVVVPGQYGAGRSTPPVDYENYHEVIEYYGLEKSKKVSVQNRPK